MSIPFKSLSRQVPLLILFRYNIIQKMRSLIGLQGSFDAYFTFIKSCIGKEQYKDKDNFDLKKINAFQYQ